MHQAPMKGNNKNRLRSAGAWTILLDKFAPVPLPPGKGGTMHLIERFHAKATDGRMVEILKWVAESETEATIHDRLRAMYATLQGWRVHPQGDGDSFTIPSVGLTVRRLRPLAA